METSAFYPYNEKIDTNDICSSLSNATNIDTSYIIYDERLVNVLSRWDSTLIYLPTKNNKNIRIYTVFDDNNKMFITDDEYTKQIILKNLICVNVNNITNNIYKQRMCIPAISDYEALYVNTPERMLGYVEYFKYYIISPLTLDDKSKVEKMNKDLLIEYITRLNEFENLVKYVECNSINNASKEKIIDSYKRLICEYHKLYHESSKDICVQNENVKTD